ncbi:uncharacterized protein F5891DRAFT_1184662 [Suillus fuscotomentosus]|uniref:Uncharacterized protein n=1 Tax=Suillus fuscotomentosus TaxID=1912939 RepID=A0AAD4EDW0_9AGAM|nr:uncharacterized protein F5891DRAFT_1184662 [Suillus fuscotomentosus]KAG1904448.1 hypothetical protein F5891DRAFT_1184662 [Suillus fuscotomentosus]
MSHNLTTPSSLPLAKFFPSGDNANDSLRPTSHSLSALRSPSSILALYYVGDRFDNFEVGCNGTETFRVGPITNWGTTWTSGDDAIRVGPAFCGPVEVCCWKSNPPIHGVTILGNSTDESYLSSPALVFYYVYSVDHVRTSGPALSKYLPDSALGVRLPLPATSSAFALYWNNLSTSIKEEYKRKATAQISSSSTLQGRDSGNEHDD